MSGFSTAISIDVKSKGNVYLNHVKDLISFIDFICCCFDVGEDIIQELEKGCKRTRWKSHWWRVTG